MPHVIYAMQPGKRAAQVSTEHTSPARKQSEIEHASMRMQPEGAA